jgi:ubiquinone/menaquinone biosynthesis C-methylase UbiE
MLPKIAVITECQMGNVLERPKSDSPGGNIVAKVSLAIKTGGIDSEPPRRFNETNNIITRVLDVGCGDNPKWAQISAPGEITYYGVDIDGAALERAHIAHPNARFIAGEAEHMHWFADGSIDAITCRVACPYMDLPLALREMARVLRPGGTITLQLHSFHFACADFLRRSRDENPKAIVGGVWTLLNGFVFSLTGCVLNLPGSKRFHESWQNVGSIRRALRRVGVVLDNHVGSPEFIVLGHKI